MRVREVMSSPVVTVPPGMPVKEVAGILVTRGFSAVPVVDEGVLVGLLSEADLVPLELVPDPRPIWPLSAKRHRWPSGSRPRP